MLPIAVAQSLSVVTDTLLSGASPLPHLMVVESNYLMVFSAATSALVFKFFNSAPARSIFVRTLFIS